eukprot:Blabericola_migrator_1__12929@NODE_851_length_6269_cov_26_562560_g231_i1_p5_GENE_NODE_851_length_6269_cov_26_562560_g231_i1NODE_851_length_6269_cov_26_562560_g231_i1_p5_ORF_typecomplete_len142_score28_25_NODE_851_length_6269_cov_26_562560_g231_i1249674
MFPHQYTSMAVPDLALVYNALKFDDIVKTLDVGDELHFNATLLELGRRGRPHLGTIVDMERVALATDLPDLFENETVNYLHRPPLAYLPKVVNHVGQIRKNVISNMDESFVVGGEFVGAPVHVKPKKANEPPLVMKEEASR